MLLESERQLLEQAQQRDRLVFSSLFAGSIALLVLPILFGRYMPAWLKTSSLSVSAVCSGSAALMCANSKIKKQNKVAMAVDRARDAWIQDQMAHEIAFAETLNRIAANDRLITEINRLPEAKRNYYLQEMGLMGLVQLPASSPPEPQYQTVATSAIEVHNQVDSLPVTYSTVEYTEPEPDEQWIYEIAQSCAEPDLERRRFQHLMVRGGSQSGKSTLTSKLIEILIQETSKHGQGAIVNLIDPKYPKTRWALTPSFTGFESVEPGLEAAIAELEKRKRLCIDAERSGVEHPDFPRYILILDEWDSVYGEGRGYGETITKTMASDFRSHQLRLFKESAAFNFTCINIGQSPLSGESGFSRSSLNSTCQVVLGSEALKWSQDSSFPFKAESKDLQHELTKLLKEQKRCALIVPNMAMPYVRAIPRLQIGKLEDIKSEEARSTSPTRNQAEIKARDVYKSDPTEELYRTLREWRKELGREPTDEEVEAAYQYLTDSDQSLSPAAIKYIREKLR